MYPELGEFCLLLARDLGNAAEEPALARVASAAVAAVPKDCRSLTISRYDTEVDYIAQPERLPQPVRIGVVSKFIAFGHVNASLIATITRRGLPCVMMGATQNLPGVVCYVPDYQQASLLALEYLGSLGHERIAIISGPFGTAEASVIELNRGVRLAFEKLHFPLEAQHVVYGDLNFRAGTLAGETLLARQPAPTAVFCMSDAVATGVIAYAQSHGIRVPDQLSVVGCGDDPICNFNLPALTTVHLPYEEMAVRAVSEADQLIRYDGLPTSRTTIMPVSLVERSSCAPLNQV
jgi:DNA-binding LacI/PurR family transcriptional regulator